MKYSIDMTLRKVQLKRNNPNNPQIKSYTKAVRDGQKNYHVLPTDGGWKVQVVGRSAQTGKCVTKEDAIKKAEFVARKEKGELIIHKKNGLIQARRSYRN